MNDQAREQIIKRIHLLENVVLIASFFLVPFAVFPPLGSALVRLMAFEIITAVYMVLLAMEVLFSGSLPFTKSVFNLPLFLMASLATLSAFVKTKNTMEAFFAPGTAALYIVAFVFFVLAGYRIKGLKKQLLLVFGISGVALSLLSFIFQMGVWSKLTFLPKSILSFDIGTLGGNLAMISFFIPTIVMLLVSAGKVSSVYHQIMHYIAIFILTLGTFINIYTMLPGKPNTLMTTPLSTSWNIAIDAFRNSPLIGVGPSNYLLAINRYRPLSYNATKYWSMRFQTASNYPLTLVTEMGIISLVIAFYLGYLAIHHISKKASGFSVFDGLVLTILVGLLLSNLTVVLAFLLVIGLSGHSTKESVKITDGSPVPLFVTALPLVALAIFVFSFNFNNARAESAFSKAVNVAVEGNGITAYDEINKANSLNPRVDRYRIFASQINISLANSIITSISQNQDVQSQNLSDADRKTVSKLIEQAINEAKAAVSINPNKAANWSNLANVYLAVAPYAQGAIDFAIQSTNQAIALDPLDPQLRITLGQMYFGAKQYDDAIDAFKTAVLAKPDWPNSHYNLAVAYRENGNISKAITEMKNVLSLLDKDTKDYDTAQAELTSLEDKLPKPSPNPDAETLSKPETVENAVTPPVELPKDAQPPIPTATPVAEETLPPAETPLP